MTWTKLSDDFGDDCARAGLSDAAARTHVEGLLWTMRRETGGKIDLADLRRFAETSDPPAAAAELVAVGFWDERDDGWQITHAMADQVEPEVVAKRRDNDAERQRRRRRKLAGLPDESNESRRDTRRDDPRDPGLVGSGLDGPGKDSPKDSATNARASDCAACRERRGYGPCQRHAASLEGAR